MPRVTCAFCGLPFAVRVARVDAEHFCCSGCALASRIPMNGDQLPVSRGLIVALVLGFGVFNELLFAVFGAAMAGEGRIEGAETFRVISIAVGGVLLTASMAFIASAQSRRWTDVLAGIPAVAVAAWAAWCAWRLGPAPAVWPVLGVNLWLAAWLSRGWLRRALQRRRSAVPAASRASE